MKSAYAGDIADGDAVDTHFAVESKRPLRPYSTKPGLWFGLDLSDRTGSIQAVYWGREDEETRAVFELSLIHI